MTTHKGKLSGQVIRGYRLLDKVASGGFSVIYRGFQLKEQRDVAVKVMLPKFIADDETVRRFEQEAQLVQELRHAHIVPIYDMWHAQDRVFIVMKWMSGGTLRDKLEGQTMLSPEATLAILEDVTQALTVAHAKNVIHRDIKPPNILFDNETNAYLSDFGLAKKLNTVKPITTQGITIGTIRYLSPEQIMDTGISPRSDIYALGITLFECLTGKHPLGEFEAELKWLAKVIRDETPPVTSFNPALPPALNDILIRATAKKSEARQASVEALLDEFRAAVL